MSARCAVRASDSQKRPATSASTSANDGVVSAVWARKISSAARPRGFASATRRAAQSSRQSHGCIGLRLRRRAAAWPWRMAKAISATKATLSAVKPVPMASSTGALPSPR